MKFRLYPMILATVTLLLVYLGNIKGVYFPPSIVAIAPSVAQESTTSDLQAEAEQLYQKGTELLNAGESQAALEIFQKVLEIVKRLNQPLGEAGTLNQMGLAYYNLGKYPQALKSYQDALNLPNL